MKNIIGFIPARSGSKDIKNKNIKKIGGKTLIDISVTNALKSKHLNYIVFSSDSDKYLNLVKKKFKNKKLILIKRPKILASDGATNFQVVKHSIEFLKKKEIRTDIIVMLQPTTPFRNNIHIDQSIDFFFKKKLNTVISITRTRYPPFWMITKNKHNRIRSLIKNGNKFTRRQDCRDTFKPSGMIYVLKLKTLDILLKKDKILPFDKTYGVEFNTLESINIDTIADLEYARFIRKHYIKG